MSKALIDTQLVDRMPDLLSYLGMSIVIDGTNPNTVGPIGWAFQRIGLTPISGMIPSDADLALVTAKQYYDLLDLAEYRLLQNCSNRFTKVRTQVGANSLYYSDLGDRLQRRIAELEADLKSRNLIGLAPLIGGTIGLSNAAVFDPLTGGCE